MPSLKCDVAVIGAGTAGLAAERAARAVGATTLLIDDRFAGTTCASVGCMPSKLLIAAAEAAHGVRSAPVFGVLIEEPRIDGPAVMTRLRALRDAFVAATLESIDTVPDGIRHLARARFVDATTLALDNGTRVIARAVVIATGSYPRVPSIFDVLGDLVLTTDTVFELPDLPRSVAVIGAGTVGLELAQALVRLGVETEVFNQSDQIAGLRDEEVATELKTILARELTIHFGTTLSVERDGDRARLSWSGPSSGTKSFERVLVATGRPPQFRGLNLEKAGLDRDDKGVPSFDRATLQCGDAAIFIAGDANADRPLLHEASRQGAIAGRNAARFPDVEPTDRGALFSITFTDPPLAIIGESAADDAVIGAVSYTDQGRAKVEARNAGLIRLYAARPDGRLTGATLLGPGMDHIGHLLAWAIDRGETATALLSLPFYHPTFEEGLKTALRQICHAVQSPMPRDCNEGVPSRG